VIEDRVPFLDGFERDQQTGQIDEKINNLMPQDEIVIARIMKNPMDPTAVFITGQIVCNIVHRPPSHNTSRITKAMQN
jgi:hypothetical protein